MMDDQNERSPLLLDFSESYENHTSSSSSSRDHSNNYIRGVDLDDGNRDSPRNQCNESSTSSSADEGHDIVCVFVVAFDARAGNIIEWSLPTNIDMDGIEFKAMPSGSHTVHNDFIYFKKGQLYGISCFENMPVDSEIERGARMKSVGVLASSYMHLHLHKSFLETQVSHLLSSPGDYECLIKFYDENKGLLSTGDSPHGRLENRGMNCRGLIFTHPAGCFSQFLRFYAEQLFILWKCCLLKKRILFFSPPPIGVVCYRVYCANALSSHAVPEIPISKANLLFYVNVTDVDVLDTEHFFIACTADKILETKCRLYDIFIDNQNVCAKKPHLKDLLTVTAGDKANYARLRNIYRQQESLRNGSPESASDESLFISFFTELNNRLFRALLNASLSSTKELAVDCLRTLNLDPSADRRFLTELIDLYGIDVILPEDTPCCFK